MGLLELSLITHLTLISLDYIQEVGDIILTVDVSLEGCEGVVMQLV